MWYLIPDRTNNLDYIAYIYVIIFKLNEIINFLHKFC